jgi:hypothetical protein
MEVVMLGVHLLWVDVQRYRLDRLRRMLEAVHARKTG